MMRVGVSELSVGVLSNSATQLQLRNHVLCATLHQPRQPQEPIRYNHDVTLSGNDSWHPWL